MLLEFLTFTTQAHRGNFLVGPQPELLQAFEHILWLGLLWDLAGERRKEILGANLNNDNLTGTTLYSNSHQTT